MTNQKSPRALIEELHGYVTGVMNRKGYAAVLQEIESRLDQKAPHEHRWVLPAPPVTASNYYCGDCGFFPGPDVKMECNRDAGSHPADLGYGTHPAPSENDKRGAQEWSPAEPEAKPVAWRRLINSPYEKHPRYGYSEEAFEGGEPLYPRAAVADIALCPHCGKSEPHTHRVPGVVEPVVFPHD